ncbi:hypothetical protein [Nocardioides ungokensis]|uniref:hypothetical protein n=1 Tax=Nocardioides ungokensis TaxID=1643322 RepID=UPI0015E02263|nr:hypothetical protein [Nocardioides ungokensis]
MERLGAATITRIKEWVGHSQVTVQPILDLGRGDAVDGREPPGWMRELVILRDGHCVFPWCHHDARSADLDHIEPYVPMDEGGPPGQTGPRISPRCAGDITAPRPADDGGTDADPTAPTSGTDPTAAATWSHPTAPSSSPATELHP